MEYHPGVGDFIYESRHYGSSFVYKRWFHLITLCEKKSGIREHLFLCDCSNIHARHRVDNTRIKAHAQFSTSITHHTDLRQFPNTRLRLLASANYICILMPSLRGQLLGSLRNAWRIEGIGKHAAWAHPSPGREMAVLSVHFMKL